MIVLDDLREALRNESQEHRLVFMTIVVITVALRLLYMTQPMRYDEAVTYMYFVRLPWSEALSTYNIPNNHLFHTFLAKGAVAVFGNQPWALRIPALLAGIAIIPAAYVVSRELYGARVALITAALLASSGPLILFSTNARGYTLEVLAFLLLVAVAVNILRGGTPMLWAQFGVIGALGFWAIPAMLYPYGAVCAWLVLSFLVDGRRDDLKRLGIGLAITAALSALLYWPVLAHEGISAVTRNRFVLPSPWMRFFTDLAKGVREALYSWTLGLPPIIGIGLAWCALLGLRRHATLTPFRVGLPLAIFTWSCWLLTVNHRSPFSRSWLWVLPIVAALAAAGLLEIAERWSRLRPLAAKQLPALALGLALFPAITVVWSSAVLTTRDTGTYRDAEDAAAVFKRVLQPGDRVLAAIPTNGPLDYYLDRIGVDRRVLTKDEATANRVYAVVDLVEEQRLNDVVTYSSVRYPAIWSGPTRVANLRRSAIFVFERKNAAQK